MTNPTTSKERCCRKCKDTDFNDNTVTCDDLSCKCHQVAPATSKGPHCFDCFNGASGCWKPDCPCHQVAPVSGEGEEIKGRLLQLVEKYGEGHPSFLVSHLDTFIEELLAAQETAFKEKVRELVPQEHVVNAETMGAKWVESEECSWNAWIARARIKAIKPKQLTLAA